MYRGDIACQTQQFCQRWQLQVRFSVFGFLGWRISRESPANLPGVLGSTHYAALSAARARYGWRSFRVIGALWPQMVKSGKGREETELRRHRTVLERVEVPNISGFWSKNPYRQCYLRPEIGYLDPVGYRRGFLYPTCSPLCDFRRVWSLLRDMLFFAAAPEGAPTGCEASRVRYPQL